MQKFINIHTHHIDNYGDTLNTISSETYLKDQNHTLGIPPISINKKTTFDQIKNYGHYKNVIAIGETGLDKTLPHFDLQLKFFKEHLNLAKRLQKPLIIHCVKALEEVKKTLIELEFNFPFLFHGANFNEQQILGLKDFNYYIGLGHLQFTKSCKIQKAKMSIPIEKIFFETDDQDLYDIKAIYTKYANDCQIEMNQLKDQIYQNYKIFLGSKSELNET